MSYIDKNFNMTDFILLLDIKGKDGRKGRYFGT